MVLFRPIPVFTQQRPRFAPLRRTGSPHSSCEQHVDANSKVDRSCAVSIQSAMLLEAAEMSSTALGGAAAKTRSSDEKTAFGLLIGAGNGGRRPRLDDAAEEDLDFFFLLVLSLSKKRYQQQPVLAVQRRHAYVNCHLKSSLRLRAMARSNSGGNMRCSAYVQVDGATSTSQLIARRGARPRNNRQR